jgi:hypothetical protein
LEDLVGDQAGQSGQWTSVDSAPFDEDVMLLVSDGRKTPYTLLPAAKRTAAGWVTSGSMTPLAVLPLKWRSFPFGTGV